MLIKLSIQVYFSELLMYHEFWYMYTTFLIKIRRLFLQVYIKIVKSFLSFNMLNTRGGYR